MQTMGLKLLLGSIWYVFIMEIGPRGDTVGWRIFFADLYLVWCLAVIAEALFELHDAKISRMLQKRQK